MNEYKVEVYYANGDVDINFFSTYEDACEVYDKVSIGENITRVCRYSNDECEEVKAKVLVVDTKYNEVMGEFDSWEDAEKFVDNDQGDNNLEIMMKTDYCA